MAPRSLAVARATCQSHAFLSPTGSRPSTPSSWAASTETAPSRSRRARAPASGDHLACSRRGHGGQSPSRARRSIRSPLSLRNVEDLLHESGIDICQEIVRFWWQRFGPVFAHEIRRKRISRFHNGPQWRWHLDEVFVKINGVLHYMWRAVDHEGEVFDVYVSKRRGRKAALKFLKKIIRRYGIPERVETDLLRSYPAALQQIGT